MKEVETETNEKADPINLAIDTPDDKMSQFTIIPTGGVNAFAMSAVIQQYGKKDAFLNTTPMEQYMATMFKFNRSRGGVMLAGLLKLAQTKVEVNAEQSAESKKYIV